MGQAKRRGTFEERKQKAMEGGRKKVPTQKIRVGDFVTGSTDEALAMFAAMIIAAKNSRYK